MARVFITGSADGLGRAAAETLLDHGHSVIVHARDADRLAAVQGLLDRGAAAVAGDLADPDQTRALAADVNRIGHMDAVIHNAGVYSGHQVLAVNVVAPYLLTVLIDRPERLIYLSASVCRAQDSATTSVSVSRSSPQSPSATGRSPVRSSRSETKAITGEVRVPREAGLLARLVAVVDPASRARRSCLRV